MRSTTIMGPEQSGHGGWLAAVAGRSTHGCMPSSERQRWSEAARRRLAQELLGGNGHDLVLAAVGIVSPAEGDAMVLESHEAMVGDGDAMGISGQIVSKEV
jgi:hypothetical protein